MPLVRRDHYYTAGERWGKFMLAKHSSKLEARPTIWQYHSWLGYQESIAHEEIDGVFYLSLTDEAANKVNMLMSQYWEALLTIYYIKGETCP